MRDSMTLNTYLEMKWYKCKTVLEAKEEWVCVITTC